MGEIDTGGAGMKTPKAIKEAAIDMGKYGEIKVLHLDNGQRVVEAGSLEKFFDKIFTEERGDKPKILSSGHCDPECPFLEIQGEVYDLAAKCRLTGEELFYYDYFMAACDPVEMPG